jgi:hypothetical protein
MKIKTITNGDFTLYICGVCGSEFMTKQGSLTHVQFTGHEKEKGE